MNFIGIYNIDELLKFANDPILLKIARIGIKASDELDQNLETITEWEYKYYKIKHSKNIHPTRKENILNMIERELRPVIINIINSLSEVFEAWLSQHNVEDPHVLANARYTDEYIESVGPQDAVGAVKHEYEKFGGKDFINTFLTSNFKYFKELIQEERNSLINDYYYQLEEAELHENEEEIIELKERISELENYNTSDEELFNQFIFDYGNGKSLIESVYDSPFLQNMLADFYAEYVFPFWFQRWEGEGIVETIDELKNVYQKLQKARNESIRNSILTINLALNSAHQTGPMLSYIENRYPEVNQNFLSELSNKGEDDIQKWDNELLEMGL